MQAVGRAGGAVVIEVRRQFKKYPGIMKRKQKPDYAKLVDLLTVAAIKEMIIPSLLPVLSPVLYFIIFAIGGQVDFSVCRRYVIRCNYNWIFVAVSMTAGGGVWDNAKNILKMVIMVEKVQKLTKRCYWRYCWRSLQRHSWSPVNPMIKITNIVALLLLAVIAG